jgi:hypothetical protein
MFPATCGSRLAQLAQLAQAVFAHLETAKDNSAVAFLPASYSSPDSNLCETRSDSDKASIARKYRRWNSVAVSFVILDCA